MALPQEWHLVTGEYPPQPGGVADYTALVARGLADAGDRVHVWCPGEGPASHEEHGVTVHRLPGAFAPRTLADLDTALGPPRGDRCILLQWVPHAFGLRSLNVPFCAWLLRRARQGDTVHVMAHEGGVEFAGGARRRVVALLHGVMAALLIQASTRVWISTPIWEDRWDPWRFGRHVPFEWLPVPSNIAVVDDPAGIERVRAHFLGGSTALVGHFGTFGPAIVELIEPAMRSLLADRPDVSILLLGAGGEALRDRLAGAARSNAGRVHAVGHLPSAALSLHLGACDVMLQPYPDGVTTRRGSTMAALAHGRAVVTNAGRLTEPFWADALPSALAPGADGALLAAAVAELLGDAERRARLGRDAASLYQARFAVQRVVERLRGARARAADAA